MTFQVGEKVRLKHVPYAEKRGKTLIYRKLFEKYEGLTATINKCYPEHDAYNIDIHIPKDTAFRKLMGQEYAWDEFELNLENNWNYDEKWLEPINTYDAF